MTAVTCRRASGRGTHACGLREPTDPRASAPGWDPLHDATETEELVLNGVQLALIGCGAEQSFASEQFERVDQVAGRRPVLACSCLHGGERLGADLSGEQLLCQSLATSGRCRSVSQRAAKSALAVEYLDHREELGPSLSRSSSCGSCRDGAQGTAQRRTSLRQGFTARCVHVAHFLAESALTVSSSLRKRSTVPARFTSSARDSPMTFSARSTAVLPRSERSSATIC